MQRRYAIQGVILAVAALYIGSGVISGTWWYLGGSRHTVSPAPSTITYKIDGVGSAMVTYVTGPGFSEQQDTVTLPWQVTLTEDKAPTIPTINAQHTEGGGTISCSVHRDGAEVASAQSSGQYVVVMCTPPVTSP